MLKIIKIKLYKKFTKDERHEEYIYFKQNFDIETTSMTKTKVKLTKKILIYFDIKCHILFWF